MQEPKDRSGRVRRRYLQYMGLAAIALALLLPILVALVSRMKTGNWPAWSGIGVIGLPDGTYVAGKTLWDLWQLLLVPAVLSVLAYLLARSERMAKEQSDRRQYLQQQQLAEERFSLEQHLQLESQRDTALSGYYDALARLLLEQDLAKSYSGAARNVAAARTIAVFRILDPKRKVDVLWFLAATDLVTGEVPIISLAGADLTNIDLSYVDFRHVNLRGARMAGANLRNARLFSGISIEL